MSRRTLRIIAVPLLALTAFACMGRDDHVAAAPADSTAASATASAAGHVVAAPARTPNEMGRIPILMYHLINDRESVWARTAADFRRDLELLHARGYRPITAAELLDRRIDIPAGTSPVVVTFDDASPSQFRYVERNGTLEIDPTSAVGIWLDFHARHPDWGKKAVFCMIPAATEGHAFFGDKDIEGQKTEWRLRKVRFLAEQGFELCNHTLWHANLAKYPDAVVQEQIARANLAIDSAVAGYRVRSFALPRGVWPKNRALAKSGAWADPRTKRTVRYDFDAIFEVHGHAVPSPHDPAFNPLSLQRIRVSGDRLVQELDRLERAGDRYVSDGNPRTVARRPATP